MPQSRNPNRNPSLDEKKERAAGRKQHDPAREAIRDAGEGLPAKGRTGGAFGGKPDPLPAIAGAMQRRRRERRSRRSSQ